MVPRARGRTRAVKLSCVDIGTSHPAEDCRTPARLSAPSRSLIPWLGLGWARSRGQAGDNCRENTCWTEASGHLEPPSRPGLGLVPGFPSLEESLSAHGPAGQRQADRFLVRDPAAQLTWSCPCAQDWGGSRGEGQVAAQCPDLQDQVLECEDTGTSGSRHITVKQS